MFLNRIALAVSFCFMSLCLLPAQAEIFKLDPVDSIQDIIDNIAIDGDEIELAEGTFEGNIDFKGKAIKIKGAGRDTIILGDGDGPVVSFVNGEGSNSTIEDLTVTGGSSNGGIFVNESSPKIINTFVINNQSRSKGSGIYILGNDSEGNSAEVLNNVIARNSALDRRAGDPHGIFIENASPNIFNNTIIRNDSNGIFATGSSSPVIKNNIMARNGTARRGVRRGRGICLIGTTASQTSEVQFNIFQRNTLGAILFGADNFRRITAAEEALDREDFANNIDANPRLFSIRRLDVRLRGNSRAIDAGDPAEIFNDIGDNSRNDIGATGGAFPI